MKPEVTPEREAFYKKIDGSNLTALWTVLSDLVTPEPVSACVPYRWRFSDIRSALIEAGGFITAKEAERRVVVLENPGFRGQSKITTSLFCGVQLVLPGEVAPAHRHSQSALRFVLEGAGAYTSVDGERTAMHYGDFVITPSQTWHDHSNPTAENMYWLDCLDIPLIKYLDASFAERYPGDEHEITKPEGDSYARYGANMLPVDYARHGATSPIFKYPYDRSREALEKMSTGALPDPCHGWKMKYVNPVTGDYAMPTIATFLQLLPKRTTTHRYRSSDATVFVCVEGKGRTRIGDVVVDWSPKDVFVVPSWKTIVHETDDSAAVLFSSSDRPVQQKIGVWREDRGNA